MNPVHLQVLASAVAEVQKFCNSGMASRADRANSERLLAEGHALLRAERAGSLGSRSIQEVLAPETLSYIFEKLEDTADVESVREVCPAFEQAAWPAFAKSFNERVFHPTEDSLKKLKKFAENKNAAPYLKVLNISTAKKILPQPEPPLTSISMFVESLRDPGNLSQRQLQELEHRLALAHVLHGAMAKLVSLETISVVEGNELRLNLPSLPDTRASDRNAQVSKSTLRQARGFDKRAHRHTLEVIYLAVDVLSTDRTPNFLPNLKSLTTTGRMVVSSLFSRASGADSLHPRLTQLTHLELAITDQLSAADKEERKWPLQHYLPTCLATMPNLTDLTLHFPRPFIRIHANQPPQPYRPLYGNTGFNCFADSVSLPHLTNLHFSHLRLMDREPLRAFLFQHRKTLSQVKITSLALYFPEWRPFMKFLADKMELQWLIMASDFSPEESKLVNASWDLVPKEFELKEEDYQNAAKKGTRLISKQGKDVVIKGREQGED